MTTTITSKGQVTIPKRVRDATGLKPGTAAVVEFENGCAVVKPARKVAKSDYRKRLDKVRGTLKLGMTTDEYMKMMRGDD